MPQNCPLVNKFDPLVLASQFAVGSMLDHVRLAAHEPVQIERVDIYAVLHGNTINQLSGGIVEIQHIAVMRVGQIHGMFRRVVIDAVIGNCQLFAVQRLAVNRPDLYRF